VLRENKDEGWVVVRLCRYHNQTEYLQSVRSLPKPKLPHSQKTTRILRKPDPPPPHLRTPTDHVTPRTRRRPRHLPRPPRTKVPPPQGYSFAVVLAVWRGTEHAIEVCESRRCRVDRRGCEDKKGVWGVVVEVVKIGREVELGSRQDGS